MKGQLQRSAFKNFQFSSSDLVTYPCGPHVDPSWLATGPQLGSPTGPCQILSLGSIQALFGLAQNGPRMGPNWAPHGAQLGPFGFKLGPKWATINFH